VPNDDRVYHAYKGMLGESFGIQTRNRIHWIIDQAMEGTRWLDVGCSQGITSLLLAERGKKVIGIDIQQENIEFAKSLLDGEHAGARENVEFICADFNTWQSKDRFDGIIMTEILEHLADPSAFLVKAEGLLEPEGKMIITVPFGVNNHPDHISTYYMNGLYSLVSRFFKVNDMLLAGRWMGLVAFPKGSVRPVFVLGNDAMVRQEENFLMIDKELTSRVECLYKNNEQANAKYRDALKKNAKLKEQIEKLRNLSNDLEKSRQILEQQYLKVQKLNAEYAEELSKYVEDYDETIGLLQNLKRFVLRLETQNDYLRRENESYQRKFAKIFDTWFGRLALKSYRWLIGMKGKLKPILK